MRPICAICDRNFCAVNYKRGEVTHYRSMCDECGRKKNKLKPRSPKWKNKGYNADMANLRSICLNCVEVVKKKEVTWKRGDLKVDY
jgi:phage terminase large subunit GpA-like protein